MSIFSKAFLIWILIALVEMLHGILRAKLIAPKVGDLRSRQLAVFTGSILIFIISYYSIVWIGPKSANEAFWIGFIWLVCMLIFEFSLGHYVFKFSWKWLLNDFNFFKGRLLAIGMLFLALAPYLTGRLRDCW